MRAEIPLFAQLARILRAQIESGELKPGRALPIAHPLMQYYGLSRNTVRRSIYILAEEGWSGLGQAGVRSWSRPASDARQAPGERGLALVRPLASVRPRSLHGVMGQVCASHSAARCSRTVRSGIFLVSEAARRNSPAASA